MRGSPVYRAVMGVCPVLLLACSSASTQDTPAFPEAPLTTLTSDVGRLRIDLRTSPNQPPVAGLDAVEIVVTDATSGAPVDGLDVTLTPWMPAMGHGASVTPLLTPMGSGHYRFTDVSLFMPGEWQLRTNFSAHSPRHRWRRT